MGRVREEEGGEGEKEKEEEEKGAQGGERKEGKGRKKCYKKVKYHIQGAV